MTGTSEFLIASDGMSCFGTIPAWKLSASTTFVVRCTDGRNGTASITLASSDTISGSGQIQLNDGQRLDFVFGPNA